LHSNKNKQKIKNSSNSDYDGMQLNEFDRTPKLANDIVCVLSLFGGHITESIYLTSVQFPHGYCDKRNSTASPNQRF